MTTIDIFQVSIKEKNETKREHVHTETHESEEKCEKNAIFWVDQKLIEIFGNPETVSETYAQGKSIRFIFMENPNEKIKFRFKSDDPLFLFFLDIKLSKFERWSK